MFNFVSALIKSGSPIRHYSTEIEKALVPVYKLQQNRCWKLFNERPDIHYLDTRNWSPHKCTVKTEEGHFIKTHVYITENKEQGFIPIEAVRGFQYKAGHK